MLTGDERRRFDEIARLVEQEAVGVDELVAATPASQALVPVRPAAHGSFMVGPTGGGLGRLWTWLTTCAEDGCDDHPVHLGWCSEHASADDPDPDEYWGDRASDPR